MRRSLLVLVVFLLGLAGLVICRVNATTNAMTMTGSDSTPAADLIARGKYLATAADCVSCHTGPDHQPFSGGLLLKTPFGVISSTNITPDKATGIGAWTGQQFYEALHDGLAPGHEWGILPNYLYPAMPYQAYTKLSYTDVMAIRAYLDSLPPVYAPRIPSQLVFPFNQRPLLAVWRLFFFSPGPMHMDPAWSPAIKHGAYLTVALGHCGACHTPRNILGAPIAGDALAGAPLEGWFAPNISSDSRYGIGGWSQTALITYLRTGNSPRAGSAYGPMREVIANATSHLSESDLQDMADYLQHATTPQITPPAPEIMDASASITRGKSLYDVSCSACHGEGGTGMPPVIPNLAGNGSVTASRPDNVITAILAGLAGADMPAIAMPAFGPRLNDQQIADITNYVRTAWGNAGAADASAAQVQALRRKSAAGRAWQMMMGRTLCPRDESGESGMGD